MNAFVRPLLLALLALVAIAAAGDQAPGSRPGAATPTSPPQASDVPAPPAQPTPTPEPPPPADAEKQLEEFVPSEEVSADRGVDFPVDI